MAYTAEDAVKTFLDYLEINETQVTFLPETKKRGIIFNDAVIFVSPVSYSTYNDKGFFDTRDSGVKERFITWKYAHKRKMKYFCIAVQSEVDRYKDYIFSLECSEQQIQNCSGKVSLFEKERSGTQIVIPRIFKPQKDFERIITDYGFYISASKRKNFLNYMNIFDNRPYEIDIEEQVENDMSEGNIAKHIDKPFNRIIFGAPGTGKSNLLKIEQDEYFPNTNQQSQVSEEEIIRKELANIGNGYSKSFSLGFQYHEFFKDKKPKFIRETYGCNAEAAYITSQGARCVDFFNRLPDYSDSEITKEKVKEQLKKAEEQNYMKEAGSAAVGRKYSNYLYGKSISEICQELELVETHTQSRFIWYGAQSVDYTFEKETSEIIKLSERVTFHPNYSYAQFVGTYKPVQDSNDDEKIKYEYVPGPFMRVYVNALKHTDRNFLLLIEEINRANVAAVFGDVFQLLDRDENGNSEYPITASEDIKKYLAKNGIHEDELKIPSNMYIWATMNSADQGVFPMDTAFKRRWEFKYIGIDENEDKVKNYEIPISVTKKVNWNELRKAINNKLISLGINEDKLLGPFFLSKSVLESAMDKGKDFVKLFESKVLMYLFEDAAKMKVRQLFKLDNNKYIYSEVCKKFEKDGVAVFNFDDGESLSCEDIKTTTSSDGELTDDSITEVASE